MSILSRTGTEKDFFLIRTDYNETGHTGYDGIMMNVHEHHPYNEPSIDRRNYNEADYAFLFGERSHIYPTASGSGAFGGVINLYGENSYGFGYRIFGFQNQGFSGGSRIGNNAKESLIYGNTINVDCTWDNNTKTYTKNNTSDANLSRYLMIFGNDHNVGYLCLSDLFVGASHNVGNNVKYSIISGKSNIVGNGCQYINLFGYNINAGQALEHSIISGNSIKIGNNVEYVNIFGGATNILKNNITDCTIFGYVNTIWGGSSINNKVNNVYMFGHDNSNSTSSSGSSPRSDVYLIGKFLAPLEHGQVIVGEYNKTSSNNQPNAYFLVGTGLNNSNRITSFAVCYNNTYGSHIYIGNTRLTETQLQSLLALIS